jgi:transcription initiation factor TFIID subunit 5
MSNTPPINNNNNPPQESSLDQNLQQQQQQQQQATQAASPSPADIDKMVASYLQKKGYKATEAIFARESSGDVITVDDVLLAGTSNNREQATNEPAREDEPNSRAVETSVAPAVDGDEIMGAAASSQQKGDPDVYDVSYKSLREWIENSLDWYKVN